MEAGDEAGGKGDDGEGREREGEGAEDKGGKNALLLQIILILKPWQSKHRQF